MRLWIKAVLLTLWQGAKWAALGVLLWALLNVIPTTVFVPIFFALITTALIVFVVTLVYLFCAFVSDNHRRLEERERQRANWDPPAEIDPDRGAVYTAGDGTKYRIGGHGKEKRCG